MRVIFYLELRVLGFLLLPVPASVMRFPVGSSCDAHTDLSAV